MNQDKNGILLRDRIETSTITHDPLIADYRLKAEVSELVILYAERLCGSHEYGLV